MAWITTKDGRRVNTEWFDEDERKKYAQIEAAEKEAQERNHNPQAGTYTVFRSGDLSGGSTGLVYLAAGPTESAKLQAERYSGRLKRKHEYQEYEVELENPLVIHAWDDGSAMVAAYNALHGTSYTRGYEVYNAEVKLGHRGNIPSTARGMDETDMMIDEANGRALRASGKYDSIVYMTRTNTRINERGEEVYIGGEPMLSQIIVLPEKAKKMKQIATHKRKNRRKPK